MCDFLQYNYNLLIPSVAKALSKRCKATKSKEFICKKIHALLKMGKIPGIIIIKSGELAHVCDNDVNVDGGGDKNVKHNVKNVQVSMDLTQDPTITDQCMLLKNMMPNNAVNSPTKKLVDSQSNMCLMCKNNVIEFHLFKKTAYGITLV